MVKDEVKLARERFGWFLRTHRERLYPNQGEVADLLGITQAHVSKWELGHVESHTPEVMRLWAEALQVPVVRVLMEAGYLTQRDITAWLSSEEAEAGLTTDDAVPIIEQISTLMDRLDRLMRADRASRELLPRNAARG